VARGGTTTAWEHFSADFVALRGSQTFTFIAEQHSDNSSRIDRISLRCITGCERGSPRLPAPASLALVGLGLGGLGLLARCRRGRTR
jgi:hypothetical protein